MKKNKPGNRIKNRQFRILLSCLFFTLLLLKTNNSTVAQGDPYEYDEGYLNAYEEVDLYIDSYNKRKEIYREETPYSSGGGYLGIGISKSLGSLDSGPPQEINGPPTNPTYPDVPVNGFIETMMFLGLGYAAYKILSANKPD